MSIFNKERPAEHICLTCKASGTLICPSTQYCYSKDDKPSWCGNYQQAFYSALGVIKSQQSKLEDRAETILYLNKENT